MKGKMILVRSLLLLILAPAFLLTSADAFPSKPNDDSSETTVLKLYRDFAWEAVMNVPGWEGLIDQPRNILEEYFDQKITTLILEDRACAEKEGLCRLGFLPIWASQDPSAGDLSVEKSDKTNVVLVKFRYQTTGERVMLKYIMAETPVGWRISDIIGPDWSLLSILTSEL
jgi:hypothetical protein